MMRLGHLPTEEELKKMVAEVDQVGKLVDGQTVVIGQIVRLSGCKYIEGRQLVSRSFCVIRRWSLHCTCTLRVRIIGQFVGWSKTLKQ